MKDDKLNFVPQTGEGSNKKRTLIRAQNKNLLVIKY